MNRGRLGASGAAISLLAAVATACAGASAGTSAAPATPPIVFTADRAPALSGEIYRIDADGQTVDLSRSPFADTVPAVSPDGKTVAFFSDRQGSGIYTVSIDGSGLARLATPRLLSEAGVGSVDLSWAPDSKVLALVSGTTNAWALSLIGPGRAPRVVARGPYFEHLAWSPDGRVLTVYAAGAAEIRAYTAAGARAWQVPERDGFASWSARGLFETVGHSRVHVYDERGRRRLLFPGRVAAWSPTGTRLASVARGRLEVRTLRGRMVFRKALKGLKGARTPLAWANSRRVVLVLHDRPLGIDTATGKTFRASDRYFLPRSPDGQSVVQTPRSGSGFALRVSALDGSGARTYGKVPGCFDDGVFEPALDPLSLQFVPGRSSLVYQSECAEPFAALYAVSPDGGGLTRLTHVQEDEESPAWSPDGAHIAYTRFDFVDTSCKGCPGSIAVADADGSHRRRLTSPADLVVDESPSWSPDGSQILFTRAGAVQAAELYVVPASGGQPRDLHIAGTDAAWGPTRIAYLAFNGKESMVWTALPDGTDREEVLQVPSAEPIADPAWSRGGTLAVIDGDATVAVATAAGIEKVRLPFARVTSLAWSPDGTRFVVTARTASSPIGDYNVYTVRTDGTDPIRLTQDVDASGASWR